jgi:ABC-type transporter Mla subunit MlaD
MGIKYKLSVLGIVTMIVIFLTGGATYYLNEVLIGILNTYKYKTGQLEQLFQLNTSVLKVSEAFNNAIVLTMMGEGSEKISKTVQKTMAEHDTVISELQTLDKRVVAQVLESLAKLRKVVNKGFEIISSGDSYGASEYYMSSLKVPVEKIKKNIISIIKAERQNMENIERNYAESLIKYKRNRNIALSFIVVLLSCLCVFAFALFRSITKAISNTVKDLTSASDQVASASSQISSSSQSLAEGASEQASSLEETSSSLEEMASMTRQNADNATQADTLMKEANQTVGKANTSMGELTTSMEDISKASEETQKIIKTIDEIAFQTNLLALNAAVEAARAGEAGAGFAVVADEVRNLAMRAADAAKNTSGLIEDTVKKIKDGSDLVTTTDEAFTEVATGASKVGELVGEIAAASNEQAQGIEQVNKAVAEMDKITQQNASNAEESASASEEMNAQAEQIKGVVGDLIALVGGRGSKVGSKDTEVNRKEMSGGINVGVGPRKSPPAQPTKDNGKEVQPDQVIPMDEDDFKDF